MADVTPGMTGAVIDSGVVEANVILRTGAGGSIVNKGGATVYIGWNGATVAADTTAQVNKCYMETNDAIRIPSGVSSFNHKTAAATAKLLFVEA
jgi:hypothetical protein